MARDRLVRSSSLVMDPRQRVGRHGEAIAADLLEHKGYRILDRNWRCAQGELDLIARGADAVIAVEVKARRSMAFGSPVEAVTPRKAQRLRQLMARWLVEHPQGIEAVRIDLVAVYFPRTGPAQVAHLQAVA